MNIHKCIQGFDFTGREMHQEQLARRLILCEIITMLTCLRRGK